MNSSIFTTCEAHISIVSMRHLSLGEAEQRAYDHPGRMWQGWDSEQRGAKRWLPAMAGISDLVISYSAINLRAPWRLDHLSHGSEFSNLSR